MLSILLTFLTETRRSPLILPRDKNIMVYQPVHSLHVLSESAEGSTELLWTPLHPTVPFNTSMSENKYIKSNQNSFTHLFCPHLKFRFRF